MSNQNSQNNNSKSSLADILLAIAKHIKLILLFVIVALFITIINVKREFRPLYTSSAVLFIPADTNAGSAFSGMARQFGINTGSNNIDISSAALYPEIVNSHTFATKLLDKEFYTEKYQKKLPLIAILSYGTGTSNIGKDTLVINTSKRIPSLVKFAKQAPFLILNVTTDEPLFSKELADTVLSELDKLQRSFKSQKVVEKKEYIDQQINIAQDELERLENKLKNFREKNRRIDSSPSLLLIQDRIQRDVQIQQGIFLTLKQQLELTKIEEVQESSFVQILDTPSLPLTISNPSKRSTYILGGLAGLFLALCIVFMVEYFNSGNPDEAQKLKKAGQFLTRDFRRIFKSKK